MAEHLKLMLGAASWIVNFWLTEIPTPSWVRFAVFMCVFKKLQRAIISFVMSVHMEQLSSH